MKKYILLAIMVILGLGPSAWSALLEQKDLLGRNLVMDQAKGKVQGVLEISKKEAPPGQVKVVMNLIVDGQKLNKDCHGSLKTADRDPSDVIQFFSMACMDDNDVLDTAAVLYLDTEGVASYLNGSFLGARLTVTDRKNGKIVVDAVSVDIKNLDVASK